MLSVAVQTQKSPLQILGLVVLLSMALAGYLLFNTWHHTANAQESAEITTLSSDNFLMFMHTEQTAKNLFPSTPSANNFKHFANSNKKLSFLDSNRYEKPF